MIDFQLTDKEFEVVTFMAKKAIIGGKSNVTDRRGNESITLDWQIAGQMGEIGFAKTQFQHKWNIVPYLASRHYHNAPERLHDGDNGYDSPGLKIDVKMTLVSGDKWKDRSSYLPRLCLIVDPDEIHADWLYIQGFINRDNKREGCLAGWARTDDLEYIVGDHNDPDIENVMANGVSKWRVDSYALDRIRANGAKCLLKVSSLRAMDALTNDVIKNQWDSMHYKQINDNLPEVEAKMMDEVYMSLFGTTWKSGI